MAAVSSVLEDEEAGERGVHVSVQVGCAVQQQQPDLVVTLQAQDHHVRCRRPVRDALRPYRRHHPAVLDDHHRRLPTRKRVAAVMEANSYIYRLLCPRRIEGIKLYRDPSVRPSVCRSVQA